VAAVREPLALRYGENPHQRAALYRVTTGVEPWWASLTQHSGLALSYLNLWDADAAWAQAHDLAETFGKPAAVIVKHANPCGAAIADTAAEAYQLAFDCDPRSAFGGIVAIPGVLDTDTVERMVAGAQADVVIAGGYDDALSWWNMTKLDTLDGYLSTRNELGAAACRPFDGDRDGTVLGEGGAFLLLEELELARARGARIYAEIAGFGSGADAYEPAPHPEGRGLVNALAATLREAALEPADVDYVAADGAGTQAGDLSEARALRSTFGEDARVVASSVKPATGHTVAAAGALNAAVAALAVHHGVVPPTLNLEHPDPQCNHADWVPREARELSVGSALAVARGFAGQNVALALKAHS
jgi:3-oxoacyl-[acyl-carrier-protein] synthase II